MMKNVIISIFIILFTITLSTPAHVLAQETSSSYWNTYEKMVELHKTQPKKIMLFMEADWCGICKRMKREVFPDQNVQNILSNHFYPVRIDIESKEKVMFGEQYISKMELSKTLGVHGTPTIIFLEEDFSVIGNIMGYLTKNKLANLLSFIHEERYLDTKFEEYQQNE